MSDRRKAARVGGGTADEFGRAVARVAVAQILESSGFNGAHRSAVDTLVDVLIRYVCHLGKAAGFHANLAGRTSCNVFDLIQALEEIGWFEGFPGASSAQRCLVGSGTVREIAAFVNAENEVPFARPVPKFPILRVPRLAPSFTEAGKETGGKHIPEWLPAFPDPHTYIRTEAWDEKTTKPGADKKEQAKQQAKQQRKAQKSLLSLQRRLALAGSDGFAPAMAAIDADAAKGKQVAGSNPFLAPPLPYGEKEVSEIEMPKEATEGKKLSAHETFAPVIEAAIEAAKSGNLHGGVNSKSVLPRDRAPVHLRIGSDRKSVVAALSSSAIITQNDSWFLREEGKDDRKRRAEMILREAMENPHELTQL